MFLDVYCTGPAYTNTVLIGCEKTKKAAIVDAPAGSFDHLVSELEKGGYKAQMLLLTHSHWDHFADAAKLKRELQIPVYVHKLDAPNLLHPGADGLPLMMEIEEVKPDHFLQEGQKISLGELELQVLHTPGHSPGGVCFYLEQENLLISGDTLFKGSIGNLSFPQSEPEKMWESLEKLAKLPLETRVLPGHGEATTLAQETWMSQAKHYFGGIA